MVARRSVLHQGQRRTDLRLTCDYNSLPSCAFTRRPPTPSPGPTSVMRTKMLWSAQPFGEPSRLEGDSVGDDPKGCPQPPEVDADHESGDHRVGVVEAVDDDAADAKKEIRRLAGCSPVVG
jgi:hypothetical protein